MGRRYLMACLFFLQCAAQWSHAGTMQEDLEWYRQSLSYAKIKDVELDSFLKSPEDSIGSFRLDPSNAPWAGNFFAMENGGIAYRWQSGDYPKAPLTKKEIKELSPIAIKKLSPTEKWDLYVGNKDFAATQHELKTRGPLREVPPVENWEGFCNGVRCAGILLPEPNFSVVVKTGGGVRIEFEPADLKALAGASYFYVEKYAQIGSPMVPDSPVNRPHPAIFDLALRHGLARGKRAFVIDSNLGPEIWNETVVGYSRQVSEPVLLNAIEQAKLGGALRVSVQLEVETLGEVGIKESNALTKARVANGELVTKISTGYDLILNPNGRIVGGVWHSSKSLNGVDFAWFPGGRGRDAQYADMGGNPFINFKTLKKLFRESVSPSCKSIFN